MKIEKKKIVEDSKWNSAVKASVAALIGVAATSMVACSSGDVAGPEDENNRENVTPNPEEIIEPEAGDPVVGPEQLGVSSSSQVVVDIPKSSSSVDTLIIEPIGPIVEPSAGVVNINIDPIVEPILVPVSSSSEELNSSSSEAKPDCDSNVRLCPDPNDPENMIVSMVTTFESTDVDV
ncbi:MAG: hypothetical protein MJZ05_07155 [Fibrobacter sp.]|nr:hypothetical protein [Fibrobacter sp.]